MLCECKYCVVPPHLEKITQTKHLEKITQTKHLEKITQTRHLEKITQTKHLEKITQPKHLEKSRGGLSPLFLRFISRVRFLWWAIHLHRRPFGLQLLLPLVQTVPVGQGRLDPLARPAGRPAARPPPLLWRGKPWALARWLAIAATLLIRHCQIG